MMQKIVSKGILHGVYIVTARTEDKVNGMTAAWVAQVSFKPLLLMVSIAPPRYTHGLVERAGYFAINTLPEGREDLAKHFGFKTGRKVDKFETISFTDAPNGSPILDDAMAYCECKLTKSVTAGDHTLFIGEVVEGRILKEGVEPLAFRWGDYF
ncbi:MAG: flavin reductase family protein [Pseudomonadota bacterium]